MTLSFEESVSKTATDQYVVCNVKQIVDYVDLIFNFGAANDCRERTIWIGQCFAKNGQFFFHQKTGYSWQVVSNALSGSMRTVCCAKCIVYEQIRKLCKLLSQFRIILFFAWIETYVFKYQHITIVQCSYFSFCFLADRFVSFCHWFAKQLGKTLSSLCQTHGFVNLTFWTTQMARKNNLCAIFNQVLDRRQSFANTSIVSNLSILHRYIKVHANKHA
ncbi:hypothetical protein D3C78_1143770 [compost metagenome]